MPPVASRLRHAWNAFASQDPIHKRDSSELGPTWMGGGNRPDRPRLHFSNERSIISSIYTRLAIDVSDVALKHVRLDKEKRYSEDISSDLMDCLEVQPNLDQAPRQFRADIAMTLFDKGVAAIVPIDTTISPVNGGGFDIRSLRVGTITQWYTKNVRVDVYNEETGVHQEVIVPKSMVAIVENPFYAVMNEPNSTLQRLIRKLNLLDTVDDAAASGKLDLIIQLPYVVKTEARRQQAAQRAKDIEFQLKGSKYGIAYTDGTEKITQLNRPAENNLLAQIEFLTEQLYVQLGLTKEVMNGTADEATMLNYNNRTIEPLCDAIVEAMHRSFLTKTARTQGQAIRYYRDPFKLVPLGQLAELLDKLSRNEIVSSNESRQAIGMKPSKDPKADELINSNMPTKDSVLPNGEEKEEVVDSTAEDADAVPALPAKSG